MVKKPIYMANVLTFGRILCAVLLIFCPTFSLPFYILYFIGGLSDVLDGMAARHFETASKRGARFDTLADIIFTAVALIKIITAVYFPPWLIIWIVCIAVIKCANIVCGFIRRKCFISEHTVLNKICGALVFAIPFCIGAFPWQAVAVLIVITCSAATFAAIREGIFAVRGRRK